MATPAEFLARCEAIIEELALLYAHTPDDKVKASLDRVLDETRAGWVETFKAIATPQDVAEVVADIGVRVQERRREIEAVSAGMA
jgi:hypothetical protein